MFLIVADGGSPLRAGVLAICAASAGARSYAGIA
jgi:hypothetical protein